jgi:hypothetical protein
MPRGPKGEKRPADANLTGLNPKQFLATKKPKTQYERIACLGYFLHTARRMTRRGSMASSRLRVIETSK